ALVDTFDGTAGMADVDVAETLSDPYRTGRLTLPQHATGLQIHGRDPTLVADRVYCAAGQQQATVDIHHALQLGTALRNGNALLPDRQATLSVDCDHLATGQTGDHQTVGRQRRPRATQSQNGRSVLDNPALVAGAGVEGDQAIILGLHHDDVAVSRRRRQHFAGHTRTPLFFAVTGIQSDHFALERSQQNLAIAGTDGTGHRNIELLAPDDLAAGAVHGHYQALYIGSVDNLAVDGRNQHVEGFALAITNGAAPLGAQLDFSVELGQLGGWQFLLAVAAATHGQNGQSQQCCIFPTHHVTHPLLPGRPASSADRQRRHLRPAHPWLSDRRRAHRHCDPAAPAGRP